jgi:hypothetical protein
LNKVESGPDHNVIDALNQKLGDILGENVNGFCSHVVQHSFFVSSRFISFFEGLSVALSTNVQKAHAAAAPEILSCIRFCNDHEHDWSDAHENYGENSHVLVIVFRNTNVSDIESDVS